jgi:hypothetical protein
MADKKVKIILNPEEICKSFGCKEPRAVHVEQESKKAVLRKQCEKCLEKHRAECKVSNLVKKKEQQKNTIKIQEFDTLSVNYIKLKHEYEKLKHENEKLKQQLIKNNK